MEKETQVATAATEQVFEPKKIGDPDFARLNEISKFYERLFKSAEDLKQKLEKCLKRDEPFSFAEFLDFLKSDARKWIYSKHIEYNDLNYPGINLEKLIELEAITIDGIKEVLNSRDEFDENRNSIKQLRFNYPISKLWNEEEQRFMENQDFWESNEKFCSRFTRSEDQNRILEKMENLRDALNDLASEGLLRFGNGITELDFLKNWFLIPSRSSDYGFSIDRLLFWKHRLNKYKISGVEKHWYTDPEKLLS